MENRISGSCPHCGAHYYLSDLTNLLDLLILIDLHNSEDRIGLKYPPCPKCYEHSQYLKIHKQTALKPRGKG